MAFHSKAIALWTGNDAIKPEFRMATLQPAAPGGYPQKDVARRRGRYRIFVS